MDMAKRKGKDYKLFAVTKEVMTAAEELMPNHGHSFYSAIVDSKIKKAKRNKLRELYYAHLQTRDLYGSFYTAFQNMYKQMYGLPQPMADFNDLWSIPPEKTND